MDVYDDYFQGDPRWLSSEERYDGTVERLLTEASLETGAEPPESPDEADARRTSVRRTLEQFRADVGKFLSLTELLPDTLPAATLERVEKWLASHVRRYGPGALPADLAAATRLLHERLQALLAERRAGVGPLLPEIFTERVRREERRDALARLVDSLRFMEVSWVGWGGGNDSRTTPYESSLTWPDEGTVATAREAFDRIFSPATTQIPASLSPEGYRATVRSAANAAAARARAETPRGRRWKLVHPFWGRLRTAARLAAGFGAGLAAVFVLSAIFFGLEDTLSWTPLLAIVLGLPMAILLLNVANPFTRP